MSVTYCGNCGTNNEEENAKFCIKCGKELKSDSREPEDEIEESEDEIQNQSENSEIRSVTSNTSSPKTVILVGLLLLGGLLGTGLGYLWLNPQINELQETVQIRDNKINSLEEQQRQDKNSIAAIEKMVLDLENKIIEKDIKLDDLENEISQKEIELNEINQELSDTKEQINILDLEIDELKINEELNKEEINDLEELKDSLQSRVSQLNSDKVDLQQTISELREEYQELKELWDLWANNRDISPQNNFGYRFNGNWCTQTLISIYGNCTIEFPAVIIPFPNAVNCMTWSKFIGTGSMRPFIFKDTIAIAIKAECLTPADIKPGDIIGFDGNRLFGENLKIGHQVIDVVNCSHDRTRTCYVTKGTNNDSIDGEIRFEEVINKIVIINF